MNPKKSPEILLQEMSKIQRMERGKLSIMRETASGPFYKLQAREKGRNVTRYVPREQAPAVQEAIEGYQQFTALTEQYVEQIVESTRAEIAAGSKKKTPRPHLPSPRIKKSAG